MNQAHLTNKYRPQTFAEVVGQEALKTILSRAAAEDRIAPAYLFSGTRGVGKTTMARVLAKAINCVKAPAAEPCNQCPRCLQITKGAAVDVLEIDGASHTGVDNVRKLKEDVGFAPLEGRYKVIIIDEAHMLSRAAFNALLKTLEEPPGHVVFILATTEPHKFPPTILSRCQHFVFKRLASTALEGHLSAILKQENIEFEPAAVNLIARRGAGSVRDAMSLLGQVLAFIQGRLTEADVRQVLGLAGQETLMNVVQAVATADCLTLGRQVEALLDQGLDLGFFLKELASVWRNVFLLKQCGKDAAHLMDLPAEETDRWGKLAEGFALPHLHACLQMTLEGQRRVLQSFDPAQSLELLLLNLALLPKLVPLAGGGVAKQSFNPKSSQGQPSQVDSRVDRSSPTPLARAESGASMSIPAGPSVEGTMADKGLIVSGQVMGEAPHSISGTANPPRCDWAGFMDHYNQWSQKSGEIIPGLRQSEGNFADSTLTIHFRSHALFEELSKVNKRKVLESLVSDYFSPGTTLHLVPPAEQRRESVKDLKRRIEENPTVRQVLNEFKGHIVEVRPGTEQS